MRIFVINLDSAKDRWKHYELEESMGLLERWRAIPRDEVQKHHSEKMISYHNIDPDQHLAKVACLMSHLTLWSYIVVNKLDNVLILEDDAEICDLNDDELPQDGITYFGGYTSDPMMTKGPKPIQFTEKINKINFDEYRVLTTMAYYIPTHYIAGTLYSNILERKRYRAIDVMLGDIKNISTYLYYPAPVIERKNISQIRKDKSNKLCNQFYELEKG
jgi:GR25 family glycosyltransferase involved in LPS biosynthesis